MLLESVVLELLEAFLCPQRINEVHKRIANIGHGTLVQWDIQEVEGSGETQLLQLSNQLSLSVAVWNITDHQSCWRALLAQLAVLVLEVDCLGHVAVLIVLHGRMSAVGRRLLGATSHAWRRTSIVTGVAVALTCRCCTINSRRLLNSEVKLNLTIILLHVHLSRCHRTHGICGESVTVHTAWKVAIRTSIITHGTEGRIGWHVVESKRAWLQAL
mmetsp:Transcript_55038/g.128756  ORF Transcript_55038/g.128756 Transcript_55038/m.128756 type:complete len:215 (-) Transcript_55038:530-1174(-)